jgi:hypothetical protein
MEGTLWGELEGMLSDTQTRMIGYGAWGRIKMDDGLMVKAREFGITAAEARNVAMRYLHGSSKLRFRQYAFTGA